MILAIIIYTLLSVAVGYLGRRRKLGYWGYFVTSLLFTPLVGLLVVFVSEKKAKCSTP